MFTYLESIQYQQSTTQNFNSLSVECLMMEYLDLMVPINQFSCSDLSLFAAFIQVELIHLVNRFANLHQLVQVWFWGILSIPLKSWKSLQLVQIYLIILVPYHPCMLVPPPKVLHMLHKVVFPNPFTHALQELGLCSSHTTQLFWSKCHLQEQCLPNQLIWNS